jgi:D-alanyl-D-alanine carboxypeptidase
MCQTDHDALIQKVQTALSAIGASHDLVEQRKLLMYADAADLVVAETSASKTEHQLIPSAADAWTRLKDAASRDSVNVLIISAFRGFDRQLELIRGKLKLGQSIDENLAVMAPPGCSEHHTGRAVDVGTPGCEPLSVVFEKINSFRWLNENAARYHYYLSYPSGNTLGFAYEPWHWCYHMDR